MFSKTFVVILSCLFLSAPLINQPVGAQTGADKKAEEARSKVTKMGVGRDVRVEVKLLDETKLKGYVSAVGSDSFNVTNLKTNISQTVLYADVEHVKKPRSGLKPLTWVIIGAAAAAIIVSVAVLYPVLCDGGAGC